MNHIPSLTVENLHTHLLTAQGIVRAVNGVSFALYPGKVLGLVGESGCGKSMTCLSILGLLPSTGRVIEGNIILNGKPLRGLSMEEMRKIRGKELGMIMQNPLSFFDPVSPVGEQFIETLRTHTAISKREARVIALEYFQKVGLPFPKELLTQFPFQLSGGMLQRVMIAIAMALNPSILLADEPTTALDPPVQMQILGQLTRLQEEYSTAILLVSHDMGVIAHMADEVAVMYKGYLVEKAPVWEIFDHPLHPYTRMLMAARPSLYQPWEFFRNFLSPPEHWDTFCPLRNRCTEDCWDQDDHLNTLIEISPQHFVRCPLYAALLGEPAL